MARLVAHLLVAIAALGTATQSTPQTGDLVPRLEQVAQTISGTLGVSVLHIESGAGASLNATEWFPMMSVYKLPIAVHTLRLAEQGTLDLDRPVTLTAADRRPGFSPLARTIAESGPQTHSIRELTSLIIRVSDNTASDSLLRNVGGPRAVARTLRELGVTGVNVDRYELEFAADYYGIRGPGRMKSFSLERFIGAVERLSPERRRTSAARFLSDRRDSATPASMARLLGRLVKGELLNPEHSKWLLDEMSEMHARDTRLRAGFPAGTRASVRPGTSGETDGVRAAQNDCAIVQLPNNRGHLVIAAFLKGSRGPDAARDAALAAVGRAAYEWAILRSAAVRKVPDRERVTRP